LLNGRFAAYLGGKQIGPALSDAQALLALEPDNEVFQFYLAYARGENPSVMPAALIQQHFDEYASAFDLDLVLGLHYTLPRDVATMIRGWHPDNKVDVLDLGCGTGLLGACLGPMEGVLVGVELSTAMIQQAHRHGVYHKFHQVNLVDALSATPENQYHVIAALDVLIYIGPLDTLVADALRILLPGGRFVFSCEVDPDAADSFKLQSTLRYTHSLKYVKRVLKKAGFVDVNVDKRIIRQEVGAPVAGLLVTAHKPATP
jgi:predicted TPR repeat methyltransferase